MQFLEGPGRRRAGFAILILLAAGIVSACNMRVADVQTNTISAANPTAFHTQSNTGVTNVGLLARDGRCDSNFAGHTVRACRYFYKAFFPGNTSASAVQAVVPAGADTNVNLAAGDITPPVGPVNVQSPLINTLQPQVKYRTQACAYVDYSDDGGTGFQGPFCAGQDTSGDNNADLNTFGPEWITATDPSTFAVSRSGGLILHWADTVNLRNVDVGNCVNATLLANNPGLAAGFNELNQWDVANRLDVRNVACDAATQEVRAFNANQGNNGIYGRASYSFFTAPAAFAGHLVFNNMCCANPTFFVNDFYVGQFPDNFDESVVKHEMGHAFGHAHDDRRANIMTPINFGTPTEVDATNRSTINFLYGHMDTYNGNSGDSTPPGSRAGRSAAAPSAAAAHDPVVRALRRRGIGGRVTQRSGANETVTYINRGDAIGVQHTVYTPDQTGRQAASAAAAAAPLSP